MKFSLISIFLLLGLVDYSLQDRCTANTKKYVEFGMQGGCYEIIAKQIQYEFKASIAYLTMAAHFSRDVTHRPGLAKFFLENALEERQHAKQMIDYLLMRGGDISSIGFGDISQVPSRVEWPSATSALKDAFQLEQNNTDNIVNIIRECEHVIDPNAAPNLQAPNADAENDYHAVDYFTGDFLAEQHTSMRTIAGHIAKLERMKVGYGDFAELIFDKELLV